MKKVLLFLLILLCAFGGYLLYDNYFNKGVPKLDVEEEKINIEELTIYGTHLNMRGTTVSEGNLDLILYNGEFTSYEIHIDDDNKFYLGDKINEGIYLESIPVGTYYAFLRSSSKDEKDNDVFKYYVLNNITDYKETTYYTFSNVGHKIVINSDTEYNTLKFNVSENTNSEIYDVVIDAGHGGMDSGAHKNGYKESDLTLKIAYSLKNKLENEGVKVKLTRTEGELASDELLPDYGNGGRAVIGHEVHAKYVFSIHLNSNSYSSVKGIEIYTPASINYDFAKTLASNLVHDASTTYSTNKINKVFDGIYTRTFSESDINDSIEEMKEKNRIPYDMKVGANYYYMIRETGGIMTGAYVDNRNEPKVLANPYYNSNIGSEAYLLELAYLTNLNDLNNINNNMDKYTSAIANSFKIVFDNSNNQE